MATKIFSMILGLSALFLTTEAQMSAKGGTDWKDSSLIPSSRMAQHSEFLNNQYNFPAKPRSQWELGLKIGSPSISGDVPSTFPNAGFGIHLRKSLGYLLSIRGEFYRGTATGFDWKGNWAPSTRYKFDDIVRYGGINYVCITGHTSAATAALGLENIAMPPNTTNPLAGSYYGETGRDAPIINLTVNGAIDAEGTARTITTVLNDSYDRGTGGANNFNTTGSYSKFG